MKAIFSIISLLLFFVTASALYANKEVDSISLLSESRFWPEKITVNSEVIGVTHGNVVKPKKEWVFLRYQDGKCLVDMGHNGIHALNVEDTDILERVAKISKERTFPFQGLFTHRYTKSFYDPKTLRGFQLGDLDQYDYFVLFYFNYESGSDTTNILGDFISNYMEEMKAKMNLMALLVTSNNVLADGLLSDYIADGLVAPTATPFLYKGMVHTLKHDHETIGDVVLVDKFGKVIKQFFLSELDARILFETLKHAIEKEAYKTF